MELTRHQANLVKRQRGLEAVYGLGNVLLREMGPNQGMRFILHYRGNTFFTVFNQPEFLVNSRVASGIMRKGLMVCLDINHRIIQDTPGARYNGEIMGLRIMTERVTPDMCRSWANNQCGIRI